MPVRYFCDWCEEETKNWKVIHEMLSNGDTPVKTWGLVCQLCLEAWDRWIDGRRVRPS